MKHTFILFSILLNSLLIAAQTDSRNKHQKPGIDTVKTEKSPILIAEENADSAGRIILQTARLMTLDEKVIIIGSCWNYINNVFKRAGFAKNRHVVFRSKKQGPYTDSKNIKAGDWIYYVNHSYGNIEHSGIFVYWIDKDKKIASILSYGGEYRNKPARYKPYKIDDVYFITRAGDEMGDE